MRDYTSRPHLSPRELEVLTLIGEGLSDADIARRLGISPSTAKLHVANVFVALAVCNRTHAYREGMRWGLIDPPPRYEDVS